MTDAEKLSMIKTLMKLDESEDEQISVYLSAAGREILAWRYSYAKEVPEIVPAEYEMTQVHAVIAGYSISGAENQTAHSENASRMNASNLKKDSCAFRTVPGSGSK